MALFLTTIALSSIALGAECEQRSTLSQIAASLNAAESSYTGMDLPGFNETRDRVLGMLECLGEPLNKADAAAFHRVIALDGYLQSKPERTVAAYRTVLALQPGFALSSNIAMPGNPLHERFEEAARLGPGEMTALYPPAGTVLFVDSVMATERPSERPCILQLTAADGTILWTGYLNEGEANPDWTTLDLQLPEDVGPLSGTKIVPTGPNVPLLASAGGAALLAGGLYGVAYASSKKYDDPDNPDIETPDDLYALRRKTNAMVYTSAGLGALAVALGVGSFVEVGPTVGWTWRW